MSRALAAALTLVVAIGEVRTRRIPTPLVALGLAVGVALAVNDRAPGAHALGLCLAFVPAFLAFRAGHLGGGGAKWFAALGWMVGARSTALMLGILALATLTLVLRHRVRGVPEVVSFASSPMMLAALVFATAVERSGVFT